MVLFKSRCTGVTTGTVLKLKWNGEVWFAYVRYSIDGKDYKLCEQLRYTRVPNTFPRKYILSLSNLSEGSEVTVCYNPKKPRKSFLKDNTGLFLT